MKISKVNHVRMAVSADSVKTKLGGTGIMYKTPSGSGKAMTDIRKQAESVNDKAVRLYCPLNNKAVYKKGDNGFDEEQGLANYCKTVFNFKNLRIRHFDKNSIIKAFDEAEAKAKDNDKNRNRNRNRNEDKSNALPKSLDFIEEICEARLKKTLRRTVKKDGKEYDFKSLFARLLAQRFNIKNANPLSDDELCLLMELIIEDRDKKRLIERIVNSIEKKDTKVQVDNSTGRPLFVLSGFRHKRKQEIFSFVKAFATGEQAVRDNMLKHIRELILLFVAGTEAYEDAKAGNLKAWTWGSHLPEREAVFSEKAVECLQESEQIDTSDKDFKKNAENKKKKEALLTLAEKELASLIVERYRKSAVASGISASDRFWLEYFETVLLRRFSKRRALKGNNMGSATLCEYLFREWDSFIAMKFVDMGKAVYHFAMPDAYELSGEKRFGEIQADFKAGLSSFDYERIKAEETLNRELSVSATYAGTVFSHNIVAPENRTKASEEDPLFYKADKDEDKKKFLSVLRSDAKRRLLQFFGGQTAWSELNEEALPFALSLLDCVRIIRNNSYHYAAKPASLKPSSRETAQKIFDEEYKRAGAVFAKKYYSNNVPVFYGQTDIRGMLDYLYRQEFIRPAQIPAFNNVLPRKEVDELLQKLGLLPAMGKLPDDKVREKYRAAVYFVLKEVYYNGFLQEENVDEMFSDAINKVFSEVKKANEENKERLAAKKEKASAKDGALNADAMAKLLAFKKSLSGGEETANDEAKKKETYKEFPDTKEYIAFDEFKKRIDEIGKNASLGEICQQLMTDVNMQNQGRKEVKSAEQKKKDKQNGNKEIYQHYKMLLFKTLQRAFGDYVKANERYKFLLSPQYVPDFTEKVAADDFCKGWEPQNFNRLKKIVAENDFALAWFITAHFLPAKQLNHLKGDLKSYRQYAENIDRRAASTGNRVDKHTAAKVAYYEGILSVLELVSLTAGQISNNAEDYFADKAEYLKYLNQFYEFDISYDEAGKLFFDERNAIINRGVALSVMFGMEHILVDIKTKIGNDEYDEYKKLQEATVATLTGKYKKCETMDEQKKVTEYQQLKNRIELYDILAYRDILTDCLSQLVSFAYLRERDLMYYQLGFHYVRLFHGSTVPADDKQRVLQHEGVNITEGALLYEIAALYTPDLPFCYIDAKGKIKYNRSFTASGILRSFISYYDEALYKGGLGLFVKVESSEEEFDALNRLRNEIDHMYYLVGNGKSLLDYYSEVYNGFFRYDTKLRKSISYILKNILMRYFVMLRLKFTSQEKLVGKVGKQERKKVAQICLDTGENDIGLWSEQFEYKKLKEKEDSKNNKDKGKYKLPARSEKFIGEVKRLLEYAPTQAKKE